MPFIAYAGVVSFVAVGRPKVAAAAVALPGVAWLIANPGWSLVAGVALLPIQHDVIGSEGGSVSIAVSDLLILVAALGLFPLLLFADDIRERLKAAVPALLVVGLYFVWLAVVDVIHFSVSSVGNTIQYAELSIVAMLLGALVLTEKMIRVALIGFVAVASFTAVLWITGRGVTIVDDKNPAGQFMVDGALLAIVVIRQWWIKFPLLALLVTGLLYTQSRGALVGGVAGALVLLLLRGAGSWRRTVSLAVGATVLVLGVYHFAPASLRNRVQTIGTSAAIPSVLANQDVVDSALPGAEYSVQLRDIYRHEGIAYARQHLADGVGVGNYLTGTEILGTETNNPHDVLILDVAEGGLPDLVLFIAMLAGTAILVWRKRKVTRWAGLALAVQAAIVTHALLDVYWVRGTPDLGWILVGAALVPTAIRSSTEAVDAAA